MLKVWYSTWEYRGKMAVRKIAISVPEDTLHDIDMLARRVGETRSGLITRILNEVSHSKSKADVTARINQVLEDPLLNEEQKTVSDEFLRTAELGSKNSKW
jgi:hypothetical protein